MGGGFLLDGAIYVATDTGTMWLGTSAKTLLQIKDNIDTNTTYTALKNPNAITISLNGTSQGAYDGSAAKSINITASSIGAAASGHTHNYAGSSSAGGSATSAVKLDSSAGSATQPVYFSNGVPNACTTYANASVKYATSAGSAPSEYAVVSGTSQPTDSRCRVWLVTNSSGTLTGVQVKV